MNCVNRQEVVKKQNNTIPSLVKQLHDEQSWSSRDSFSSTESSKVQWFKKHRKLSFSRIHRKRYLNMLAKSGTFAKENINEMKFFDIDQETKH